MKYLTVLVLLMLLGVFAFGCGNDDDTGTDTDTDADADTDTDTDIDADVGAVCEPSQIHDHEIEPGETILQVEEQNEECIEDLCLTAVNADASGESVIISGCTCPCMDVDGSTFPGNLNMCECPPWTLCQFAYFSNEDGLSENEPTSYCVPVCMVNGCEDGQTCTPPEEGSNEPWMWTCQ